MSEFVRYTCNKKNKPTMREDCMNCPEYNPCAKDGKWCFVGALIAECKNTELGSDMTIPSAANMVAPVMRDTSTVTINLGNEQTIAISKEDFEREIRNQICRLFDLPRGFWENGK